MWIFTQATLIFLWYRNLFVVHISFLISVGVGISRMYLLQYFFIDIYFGALLGVIAAICVQYITYLFESLPKGYFYSERFVMGIHTRESPQ